VSISPVKQARLQRAYHYAERKHHGQMRKHGNNEPYVMHVVRVCNAVIDRGGDFVAQEAALLHDTIEDTKTTYDELFNVFGKPVADTVLELTDVYTPEAYPTLNRRLRKAMEAERLRGISDRAKLIKLCDIADNTRDIVANNPGFAPTYLREKAAVLEAIGFSGESMG
jgi:(p)ppGpp synthase/HD superfamily hydrolase